VTVTPPRVALGIDVGGTEIKAGLVNDLGQVLHLVRRPTPTGAVAAKDVVEQIRKTAELARAVTTGTSEKVEGVGITTPAFSTGAEWVQLLSSNIPVFEGFPLYRAVSPIFGPSVVWEYDTHAALLAEMRFGRAGNYARVLYVGIGTGVSCGIAIDGELVRHTFGTCGNAGHVIVDHEAPYPCTCGGSGCLESVVSGWAMREAALRAATSGDSRQLAETYRQRGDLSAADLSRAARNGDNASAAIFARAGRALGSALASWIHIYFPDAIFFGGGVSGAGELLLEPARATMDSLASPTSLKRVKVFEPGLMGADAGVIGAASSVFHRITEEGAGVTR
jgi:glucokinase